LTAPRAGEEILDFAAPHTYYPDARLDIGFALPARDAMSVPPEWDAGAGGTLQVAISHL
jgi:hypothetical protein